MSHFDILEEKIVQLLNKLKDNHFLINKLKIESQELEESNLDFKTQISRLKSENDSLKIANSLLGSIICADVIGEGISSKRLKLELKQQSIKNQFIPQIIRIVDSFEHVLNGKKKIIV